MMTTLLLMIVCAVLYAIKGGSHYKVRKWIEHKAGIEHYANGQPIDMTPWQYVVHRLVDGKLLSALIFGVVALVATSEYQGGGVYNFRDGALWFYLFAVGQWLAAVSPKMGRTVGMIGGYKGNWDENENPYPHEQYLEKALEGWKQGFIRGVWMGAMMALLFNNPACILAGLMFPSTAWFGVSFEQWRTGTVAASWHWHEYLCGALCLGYGISLAV